jgi:pilus assembly protein FimV
VAEIVEKGTSYSNIMLGSLAILLLAIGGFFSWRKRQAELQNIFKATDSTVLAASSEATKEDEVVVLATPVEASFDTKTTEHIKVKEEVMDDVLLDADTYLAYGKYDEAEKSLRQELKVSPYKDSYKLKLLEVFYSSENNEAFDDFI